MRQTLLRRASAFMAFIALAISNASPPARAEEPLMQLETGGHTATIRGLAVSPERSTIMVSGGYDKVARVWDINKGETIQWLRGASGPGEFGSIYALAIAPRGTTVALAGYMDPVCPGSNCGDIRIFEWDSGKMTGRLTGVHTNIVLGLAYSKSGRYLASVSPDDRVAIWNVATRAAEATIVLPKRAQPSKVAFLNDDRRLVVAGKDGIVRLIDRTTKEITKSWTVEGSIYGLATSLDGQLIAVGGKSGIVTIIDVQTGEKAREIANGSGAISALAFGSFASRHHIVVGPSASPFHVNVWDADNGQHVARHQGHDNTVPAVTFSYDGKQVYSAGGSAHAIHLWSPGTPDKARSFKSGSSTIYSVGFLEAKRPATTGATLIPSAGKASTEPRSELYIAWGRTDPCPALQSCPDQKGVLEYAMRLPDVENRGIGKPELLTPEGALDRGPGAILSSTTRRAALVEGDLRIERVADEQQQDRFPQLTLRNAARTAAKPVPLLRRGADRGFDHLSYTFSAGGSRIYSGGRNGVLDSFNPDGTEKVEFPGHSGDVWSVVDSPSGKLVLTGAADQTVRLWNAATGELIVTLLHINSEKWVMWTPQGYHASSAQGDKLVGWQVNRGRDAEARIATARNLSAHFLNPKAVELAILRGSAVKAIEELGLKPLQPQDLDKTPKVKIKRAEALEGPAGLGRVSVDLGDNEEPITKLTLFVNELKFEELQGPLGEMLEFDVPLQAGTNVVRVVVRNAEMVRNEISQDIELASDAKPPPKGRLVLVAIGVNKYQFKTVGGDGEAVPRDLNYSVADARAMLETLGRRLQGRHAAVHTALLVDGAETDAAAADEKREPTKSNIDNILDIVRGTTRDDTLIIFVAGHGLDLGNEGYIFLPNDARWSKNGWDSAFLVKWQALTGALQVARGRRYLFVDTCQSAGAVDEHMLLMKNLADDDIVAFTAASRKQDSWEFPELGHGVFTSAVLAGIAGEADRDGDHVITVLELGNYVKDRVQERTNKEQLPEFYHPRDGRDFSFLRY